MACYLSSLACELFCHESFAVLPQKVCRKYKQNRENKHNFARKGALFSWQGYGSELAEVANLSDNASL